MEMNEINSRFKVGVNKINLMLLSVIRNKSSIIMILLFPFFSIVPTIFFSPFWAISPFVVELNVIVVTGLVYGNIVFGYKRSTLDNNEKLVSKSRSVSYLSSLIVIIVFVLLSSMIQILLLCIANWIDVLLQTWIWVNNGVQRHYKIKNIRWVAWLWGIMWITLITFGVFFSARKIMNSKVTHYNVTLALCIISFIWGGSLNDYYPNLLHFNNGTNPEFNLVPSLFPAIFYWPTVILFPFYAPGQIISIASDFSIVWDGIDFNSDFIGSVIHLTFNQDYEYSNQWNALIITPILWTSILFIIGVIQSNKV